MKVIVTEDQYIEDLASLFRRYGLRPGSPGALENLADQLQSNPALRGDLFNLCTAISHMGETDLSPDELLRITARALAGRTGQAAIPATLQAVFLDQYSRWSNRQPAYAEDVPDTRAQPQIGSKPLRPSAAPFSTAATLSGTDRRWAEPEPGQAAPEIPPDTPIGELTISQLRSYLDEIETRVGRLQPYLESLRGTAPDPVAPEPQAPVPAATVPAQPEPIVEASLPAIPDEPEPPATPERSIRAERQTSAEQRSESHDQPAAFAAPHTPDPMQFRRGRRRHHLVHSGERATPESIAQPIQQPIEPPMDSRATPSAAEPLPTLLTADVVLAPRRQEPIPVTEPAVPAQQAIRHAKAAEPPPAEPPKTTQPEPEDEPKPILLPVRGTTRRSEPVMFRSAGLESDEESYPSSPEPVIFRNATEPQHSSSRYVLAAVASLILIASSGAGYHYYIHRNDAGPQPTTPAPQQSQPQPQETPAEAAPAVAPAPQQPSGATEQTPPAAQPAPARRATPQGTSAAHRPRALSRAMQVEAEAARSEAQSKDSTPPPAEPQ